jgi:cytochrome c-type biogenesis protein CcmF
MGMLFAHLGMGIFVVGVMFVETVGVERDVRVEAGDTIEIGDYRFEFQGVSPVTGPNYRADEGLFVLYKGEREVAQLRPQKRLYSGRGNIMTEAAIDPGLTRDVYVSLGEPVDQQGRAWAVRVYVKPYVRWIWLGAIFMTIGGLLGALDRRYLREARQRVDAKQSGANAEALA